MAIITDEQAFQFMDEVLEDYMCLKKNERVMTYLLES